MAEQNIKTLIKKFTDREDLSIALANEIEVALDDLCPDNELIQDTIEMLATYRPGGGDFLYDEEAVISRLEKVMNMLSPNNREPS